MFRVTLNFSELGIPRIRKMWMTFAPRAGRCRRLPISGMVRRIRPVVGHGAETTKRLKVASTGSVRVSSIETACTWSGDWQTSTASLWTMPPAAPGMALIGQRPLRLHASDELWLGTVLTLTSGTVLVELDGEPLQSLSALLDEPTEIVARRRISGMIAPGEHVVRLTNGNGMFTFDFLEAAVPGDLPDPLPANPQLSPALDYSTDHTYKLPPARILWAFDQLGYTGPMNEYLGVFWWNERAKDGGSYPECTVEFTGVFAAGDSVWLKIGRQPLGKSVFPGETAQGIANHFMYVINSTLVGVWALAEGNFLRVRARSAAAAYSEYAVTGWVENAAGSTGEVTGGGPMSVGVMGDWQVDPSAEHALNRAATDWHKDFFAQVAARNRRLTTAISMELVNPPAEFSARYPDSSPVITDVGFAALKSTHCAFRSDVRSYQAKVLAEVAVMMADAGLTPDLQCGEFTWWYFTNRTALHPAGGMAYYDSETAAAAQAALGRPLHVFTGPNDDPSVNGGADALFLRNRLRDHVSALMASVRAAVPGTQFEVLFPYDVNYPVPKGIHQIGGQLNRYVNLPDEWAFPGGGLDRLKLEMLNFGAWSRDLDLVKECLLLPGQLGWPGEKVGLMTPIFKGGYPWSREVAAALEKGFHCINLWAFDHVCLYALSLEREGRRAAFQG